VRAGDGRFTRFFQDWCRHGRCADRIGKFRILMCRRLAKPIGTVISQPVFSAVARLAEQVSAQLGDDALLRWATEKPCATVESAVAGGPAVLGGPCSRQ
jgi:hypothetical protein